jgi:hypothetical protein
MRKTLTLAAAALTVAALTTQAGITVSSEKNDPYCAQFPHAHPWALEWEGTWDLTADTEVTTGANWTVTLSVDEVSVLGSPLYFLRVDGNHEVPSPGPTWTGSLGLLNIGGQTGTVSGTVDHGLPDGDYWELWAEVNPVGNVNWRVSACHVPEPSTYAMLAGLGLAGFALYRRMKA